MLNSIIKNIILKLIKRNYLNNTFSIKNLINLKARIKCISEIQLLIT